MNENHDNLGRFASGSGGSGSVREVKSGTGVSVRDTMGGVKGGPAPTHMALMQRAFDQGSTIGGHPPLEFLQGVADLVNNAEMSPKDITLQHVQSAITEGKAALGDQYGAEVGIKSLADFQKWAPDVQKPIAQAFARLAGPTTSSDKQWYRLNYGN